jgi:plasmid maintenance system antidote protein VapI
MADERLRAALERGGWTLDTLAETVQANPETIERWITKERTPHRKTAIQTAKSLGEDPGYLWPNLNRRVVTDETYGEVITCIPDETQYQEAYSKVLSG